MIVSYLNNTDLLACLLVFKKWTPAISAELHRSICLYLGTEDFVHCSVCSTGWPEDCVVHKTRPIYRLLKWTSAQNPDFGTVNLNLNLIVDKDCFGRSEVYEFLSKLASKIRPRKSLCLTVDCLVNDRMKSFTSFVVEHFGKSSTLSSLEIPFDPALNLLHSFESADTNLVRRLKSLKLYIPEGNTVVMKPGSLLVIKNRICAYKCLTALQLPVPLSSYPERLVDLEISVARLTFNRPTELPSIWPPILCLNLQNLRLIELPRIPANSKGSAEASSLLGLNLRSLHVHNTYYDPATELFVSKILEQSTSLVSFAWSWPCTPPKSFTLPETLTDVRLVGGCALPDRKISIGEMLVLLIPAILLNEITISVTLVEIPHMNDFEWVRDLCIRWPCLRRITICQFDSNRYSVLDLENAASATFIVPGCLGSKKDSVEINCEIIRQMVSTDFGPFLRSER